MPLSFQIGTDIVSISRMRQAIERQGKRFLDRVFSEAEQAYCERKKNKYESYAARFAAKEAVIKAKGGGKGRFNFRDIEVRHGANGKPLLYLSESARRALGIKPSAEFLLTLAHEREYAVATVVMSVR